MTWMSRHSCGPLAERGSALLITMLVMAITVAMGFGIVTLTLTDLEISGNFRNRAAAYYAADSGIEQTIADFNVDPSWIAALIDPADWSLRQPAPSTLTINGHTLTLTLDSDGSHVADDYALGTAQALSQGTFERTLAFPPTIILGGDDPIVQFRVRSTGSGGIGIPSSQLVRADIRLSLDSYGVWDNAIFANKGQDGNVINGNVAVRGSVHIIGDPLDPPTIELSGSADIRNSYADAEAHFGSTDVAKLPALDTVEVNGVAVETLDAVIRLKRGTIDLSGSSDIGMVNDDTNSVKETVDAIRADGTVGPSDAVYTDEWSGYDAQDVTFPSLDDPYYDYATATNWSHHRDYLDATAMTIAVSEISRNTAAFSYSDGSGNSIDWDPDAALLTISGIVRIDGDIQLGKPHGKQDDAGTGTVYATGDVEIEGWIVPENGYIQDGNLGLIAEQDVLAKKSSNINIMAAIYAEDTIRVSKQTNIAGALVANYFDMGENVPGVFHVPSLSSNVPPGMPGANTLGIIRGVQIANWYQEYGQ